MSVYGATLMSSISGFFISLEKGIVIFVFPKNAKVL